MSVPIGTSSDQARDNNPYESVAPAFGISARNHDVRKSATSEPPEDLIPASNDRVSAISEHGVSVISGDRISISSNRVPSNEGLGDDHGRATAATRILQPEDEAGDDTDLSYHVLAPNNTSPKLADDVPAVAKFQQWLPVTLYSSYLFILAIISFALSILCIALSAYSSTHYGLSNTKESNGFKFSWRFLPTLVAVLYTLLWTPIMNEVLQTEPWALLSLPGGSEASSSLLRPQEFWWTNIINAARNKRKTGGVRWAVLLATSAAMISSLVINPLSAGLLGVVQCTVTRQEQFLTIAAPNSTPILPVQGDATFLKTVTNLVFNTTTSAWLHDDFSVMPFWPSYMASAPLGAHLSDSPLLWQGITSVFQVQFECTPFLPKLGISSGNISYVYLHTSDGCDWTLPRDFYTPTGRWGQFMNSSSACGSRDYISLYSPDTAAPDLQLPPTPYDPTSGSAIGKVCTTTYFTAKIPVNVSISSSQSVVSIDTTAFSRQKRPLDSSFISSQDFESSFIGEYGTFDLKYQVITPDRIPTWTGPILAAAIAYQFNITAMMLAPDLAERARVVKQRFFGEALQSIFSRLNQEQSVSRMPALVTTTSSRLVASLGIGIALGALFLVLGIGSLSVLHFTRLGKRPLQLGYDPNKTMTAALMIQRTEVSNCLEGLDRATTRQIEEALHGHIFSLKAGKLQRINKDSSLPLSRTTASKPARSKLQRVLPRVGLTKAGTAGKDWRPFILRLWNGYLLALYLSAIIGTLIAVYEVSRKSGLYQSALVYHADIKLSSSRITSLAPYSIIPTLVAALAKLWWSALDDCIRRLSPFLAMVQSARKPSDGIGLSYATTPILWVTFKAAKKGHWLLALVTLCSLTLEILQIGMSALWTKEAGILTRHVNVQQTNEIRTVSHVFPGSIRTTYQVPATSYSRIEEHLYGGTSYYSSWLFSGVIQCAYNSTPPSWTVDGWGFPPLDLSNVTAGVPEAKLVNSDQPVVDSTGPGLNVTFDSPALRGNIECSPVQNLSAFWIKHDLTDGAIWNLTANPRNLQTGYELSNQVRFGQQNTFADLGGATPPEQVSIGQWLLPGYTQLSQDIPSGADTNTIYDPSSTSNFTVLWIVADYPQQYAKNYLKNVSIFSEINVQALNCQPVFESANSRITVSVNDGKVQHYTLLDEPKNATEAWSDAFTPHYTNKSANFSWSNQRDADYNNTVSWGYLFQIGVLEASNVAYPGNPTPFTFYESDLNSDFFSYASLALANNNRSALLDHEILANISQKVYSVFFQSFISLENGYDGFWAYQPLGAELPFGLDSDSPQVITHTYISTDIYLQYPSIFGTTTATTTWEETYYAGGPTGSPTLISDETSDFSPSTYVTNANTMIGGATSAETTGFSDQIERKHVRRTDTPQPTSTTTPKMIPVTLSIHAEVLVISPAALFLCIGILAFLIISTFVIYLINRQSLKLFPRDVTLPASVLGFVYGSEKLKAWVERQDELGSLDSSSWTRVGGHRRAKVDHEEQVEREKVLVKMGYFVDSTGEQRWGIELDTVPETKKNSRLSLSTHAKLSLPSGDNTAADISE